MNQSTLFFFDELIDPIANFDDSLIADLIETVSPFIIKNHNGPSISFTSNDFSDNIGILGGVLQIRSASTLPSEITISQNTFERNMAYVAGNAFHIDLKSE